MEIVIQELIELKKKWQYNELTNLVKKIDFVVYGVRQHERVRTILELLLQRPYSTVENYQTDSEIISVLTMNETEPVLIICEAISKTAELNRIVNSYGPKIYSIGYNVSDVEQVFQILQKRNVQLNGDMREQHGVKYFSTIQSAVTFDSNIYVERKSGYRRYDFIHHAEPINLEPEIIDALQKNKNIKVYTLMNGLDHIAYRVHHSDFISVADEIMKSTPYMFSEAHEIAEHDAYTIVFRNGNLKPALVASYGRTDESLVEQYVSKYGPRIHHIAYEVKNIFDVTSLQKERGITYTSEKVIGTREEGIVQIFTTPSLTTNEITEYVQRFDGFTGFFSDKNVGNLMTSTRAYQ